MRPPQLRCPRCARTPARCDCAPGLGPLGRPYGALHVGLATEAAADLSSTEAHLLQVLARRSTGTWGVCWAAVETLADASKLVARTVQRKLARLVELGWLVAEERVGDTTVYAVCAAQVWAALAAAAPTTDVEDPEPAEEVSRETSGARGVIDDRGRGDPVSPDQITDPIEVLPPVGSPPPAPPASSADLPPAPSLREGEPTAREPRAQWASDRALLELTTASDPWATLARYDRGERALVQVWRRYIRTGVWPDAPDGLRAREVRRGLADAARRWRAGERLAPAAPPPLQLGLRLDEGVSDGLQALVDAAVLEAVREPPPVSLTAQRPPGGPASTPLVGTAALLEARRRRAARLAVTS